MRSGRPGDAGRPLRSQPWWFGPHSLPTPAAHTPFDLVLLDRDGTLNVRVPDGYVTRPEDLELLPGAAAGVGRLTRAGCTTVLVTNQRGLARGLMDRADLEAIHERLQGLLAEEGGRLDGIVVCPHARGTCECRKPRDGLFREALARAPWADPGRCLMVGDMPSDLDPASGLGMRTEKVGSGRSLNAVVVGVLPVESDGQHGPDIRRGEDHVP